MCPKRNWICSNSPPEAWQSRAQVRRRSCGANFATPMRLADSFTMCQTAFTVMPSPHVLPTLLTRRNSFPRSIPLLRANRRVQFSPNQELELFERGLPCRPDQQWPNDLRVAGGDPISTPRLHAVSSRTRAAILVRLGRVFLSVVDDRVLAKGLGPAPRSANCRGALPTSSRPQRGEYQPPN